MIDYIPRFFTKKAIALYFIALLFVSVLFFGYSMSLLWIFFGALEVFMFFYFSNRLSRRWRVKSADLFKKNLFFLSLIIRVVWVVISYFFYIGMTGQPFEFEAADSMDYHAMAVDLATRGYAEMKSVFWGLQINDMGYGTYLGTLYMVLGKSIFLSRLVKALLGAFTVVLIYKLASRNFGESTGRMAGIMAMLFPNLILYSGLHLKEVEMLFLVALFLERTDNLLRGTKLKLIDIFVIILIGVALFTFRTILGVTAFFALFSALIFSKREMGKYGNRIMLGIWLIVTVGYLATGTIANEVDEYWAERSNNQKQSMVERSKRKMGNKLSKYGSGTLFAPAIFVIPVSTMVDVGGQQNQLLIHGGNFIKNILSFFIYLSMFFIIRNKKWKDFVLIEVFLLSYLAVVSLSAFAHSERFHQPILPVYIAFIAYGISKSTNKTKKYFTMYSVFLFLVLLAWNFVKLKGRGLI